MSARSIALSALVLVSACSGALDPGDAGTIDAQSSDASELDAAPRDASEPRDASADAFTWGECSAFGMIGECVDVADCDGISTPGLCPGPSGIQCCTASGGDAGPRDAATRDGGGALVCDPDAMPLPNEGLVEAAGEDGCPDGMVGVDTFCVDRFEASLLEIASDGTTRSWSPYFNPGTRRVRAVSIEGAVPQAYVTGVQAAAACAESGKRLCSDTEWLRACQGSAGSTYPYGTTRMPGVCNDARAVHPAVEYFGTSADWIWSELGHPCIDQLPDSLDRTGDNPECISESGALDMMGNLHEWTSAAAGTFRGGFYVDTVMNGPGCLYATTAHDRSHWDYSTGFRCCADLP